jgi:hypothetical protein
MVCTGAHPAISSAEASMENDSTVYVGLDVHKESITVAYAIGIFLVAGQPLTHGKSYCLKGVGIISRNPRICGSLDILGFRLTTPSTPILNLYEHMIRIVLACAECSASAWIV